MPRAYEPIVCPDCRRPFTPAGPRTVRCPSCRPQHDQAMKQAWQRTHRRADAAAAKSVHACRRCGTGALVGRVFLCDACRAAKAAGARAAVVPVAPLPAHWSLFRPGDVVRYQTEDMPEERVARIARITSLGLVVDDAGFERGVTPSDFVRLLEPRHQDAVAQALRAGDGATETAAMPPGGGVQGNRPEAGAPAVVDRRWGEIRIVLEIPGLDALMARLDRIAEAIEDAS